MFGFIWLNDSIRTNGGILLEIKWIVNFQNKLNIIFYKDWITSGHNLISVNDTFNLLF